MRQNRIVLVVVCVLSILAFICHVNALNVALFMEEGTSIETNPYLAQALKGVKKATIDYPQVSYRIEVAITTNSSIALAGISNMVLNYNVSMCILPRFFPSDYIIMGAQLYPHVQFIVLDQLLFGTIPQNALSVVFAEDQLAYLTGILAGKRTKTKSVGAIGGLPIDAVRRFLTGFQQGVLSVCANCTVYLQYSYSFIDFPASLGQTIASAMIADNVDVIFTAAGGAGAPALLHASNVNTRNGDPVYVIGVDNDQYYDLFATLPLKQRSRMITSSMKRLDVAVSMCIGELVVGTFHGGKVRTFDTSNGGVSLAPCHDACSADNDVVEAEVRSTYNLLADGRLSSGVNLDGSVILSKSINRVKPVPITGHALVPINSHVSAIDMDGGLGARIIIMGGRSHSHAINHTYYYDIYSQNMLYRTTSNMLYSTETLPALTNPTLTAIDGSIDVNGYGTGTVGVLVLFGGRHADSTLSSSTWVLEFGANFISYGSTAHAHYGDEWLHLTNVTSPDPRTEHVAVQIPNGVMIYGGRTQYEIVNDIWTCTIGTREKRYQDSVWTRVVPASSSIIPPRVARHTALNIDATSMIVFGGVDVTIKSTSNLYMYNITSRTWTQLPSAPASRSEHTAVWVTNSTSHDRFMMIVGGRDASGNIVRGDEIMLYSLKSQSWSIVAVNTTCGGRTRHTSHAINNRVYIIGGIDAMGNDRNDVCYMDFDANQATANIPLSTYTLSRAIQIVIFVLVGLSSTIILITMGLIIYHRYSFLVRAASFAISIFILVCLLILSIGSIFYALSPAEYPAVCHIRPWFTCIGLVGALACLAVKTNRVRKIFTNRKLNESVQSNRDLFIIVSVLLTLEIALLIGNSASNLSHSEYIMGEKSTNGYLVDRCTAIQYRDSTLSPYAATDQTSTGFVIWMSIQFAYIGVFLISVTTIAWRSRHVPSCFNEASRMVTCLFILSFFCFLLVPLNFLVDDNPAALMLIRGGGQIMGATSLCAALFGPLLFSMYMGTVNDRSIFDADMASTAKRTSLKERRSSAGSAQGEVHSNQHVGSFSKPANANIGNKRHSNSAAHSHSKSRPVNAPGETTTLTSGPIDTQQQQQQQYRTALMDVRHMAHQARTSNDPNDLYRTFEQIMSMVDTIVPPTIPSTRTTKPSMSSPSAAAVSPVLAHRPSDSRPTRTLPTIHTAGTGMTPIVGPIHDTSSPSANPDIASHSDIELQLRDH